MRLSLLSFGLLLVGALAPHASAQVPTCQINVNPQTDTYTSPYFDNRINQCTYWVFNYQVTGFSAVSIEMDSATGASAPGSFGLFSGTITTGSNPSTSTACATPSNCTIVLTGQVAWYRVAFTTHSGSGSIQGVLKGYPTAVALGGNPPGGTGTGCSIPCPVKGVDAAGAAPTVPPVPAAGFDGTDIQPISTDTSGRTKVIGAAAAGAAVSGNPILEGLSDGANAQNAFYCPLQAVIAMSGGTDVVIAAGVSSKKTYVCHIDFGSDTVATFTIRQGTGTTCLTGTAAITGGYQSIVSFAADYSPLGALHSTTNANDICIHASTASTIGGIVTYAQF